MINGHFLSAKLDTRLTHSPLSYPLRIRRNISFWLINQFSIRFRPPICLQPFLNITFPGSINHQFFDKLYHLQTNVFSIFFFRVGTVHSHTVTKSPGTSDPLSLKPRSRNHTVQPQLSTNQHSSKPKKRQLYALQTCVRRKCPPSSTRTSC